MKALYSHICRLRTLCALVEGMVAFVSEGWAALAPAQLLLLGCELCILLRVVIPSPPSGWQGKRVACLDLFLSGAAAVSFFTLTMAGFVDFGLLLGGLALGV